MNSGSYYFLSRPRRFGKSLLISTLEAYFQGKRELFEGLAMEKLEKNWVKRPVLHLDLNIGKYDTPDSLDKILDNALSQWEAIYGTGIAETTLALRFKGILERAYKQTSELERHYQNVLFIVFKLVGFYTQAEYHTSEGRIDLVVKTTDYIYVMEFKLECTAEEAIAQIEEKHYAHPFETDSRKLFKIGINFSNKMRNIERWIVKNN